MYQLIWRLSLGIFAFWAINMFIGLGLLAPQIADGLAEQIRLGAIYSGRESYAALLIFVGMCTLAYLLPGYLRLVQLPGAAHNTHGLGHIRFGLLTGLFIGAVGLAILMPNSVQFVSMACMPVSLILGFGGGWRWESDQTKAIGWKVAYASGLLAIAHFVAFFIQ